MSVAELKEEAIRQFAIKVGSIEDETGLKIMLEFLGGIKSGDNNSMNLSHHYSHIKSKYSSVLKKLAE